MQQPSNGFFYVIDRSNGKLLSADKYAKATWAERIDLKTGLPVEIDNLRYEKGPVTIYPGQQGAHNWQPSAYNPQTGLVYIPTTQTGAIFNATPEARKDLDFDRGKVRLRAAVEVSLPKSNDPLDYKGGLIAWDPIKKKIAWRVSYPYLFIGGAMTTKSNLVFQGTVDGNLYAYDGVSGKRLWSFNVGHAILAAPITYSVNGRQYVSVLAGVGGSASEGGYPSGSTPVWKYGLPRRLLTFALDAKGKLPAPVELPDTPPVDDPKLVLNPARVARGDHLYNYTCGACHGGGLISMGGGPDLRGSSLALDRSAFRQVVMDGAMVSGGMPKWDITDDQLEDVYQYIRAGARMEILERKGRPADASVAGLSKKAKSAHR
jgi:quinohemoprotein ethanol dehydrogenase